MAIDGNMQLVHLRSRRPDDDVSLSDGELFMVKRAPYAQHLATAPDRQQVCPSWEIFYHSLLNGVTEISM
jgi:hypothetical protein